MENIILTVQSGGSGNWRLGISKKDSQEIFKCRGVLCEMELPNVPKFDCKTACGCPCDENGNWILINKKTNKPYKKGYDLNNKLLNDWIIHNKYHCYVDRIPTTLEFSITRLGDKYSLKFLKVKR